jgi:YebC/PmpR family DNA-binding regulatory protein
MSGHNRWSKVKNVKGAIDAKRGKLFTKLTKELIVAARTGGGKPDSNARLRQAVSSARAASMPKENIERAIKKGTGELQGETIEEIVYEGYGPAGVAVLVETTTDNKNRTVNDLRSIFKSHGGNLGESGSVAWMFTPCGQILFDQEQYPEDKVMEVALESGASDVASQNGTVEVITDVHDVDKVRESFERVGMHPVSAGRGYQAKSTVKVEKIDAEKVLSFMEAVDDHDDVQKLHSNFVMDDAVYAEISKKQ